MEKFRALKAAAPRNGSSTVARLGRTDGGSGSSARLRSTGTADRRSPLMSPGGLKRTRELVCRLPSRSSASAASTGDGPPVASPADKPLPKAARGQLDVDLNLTADSRSSRPGRVPARRSGSPVEQVQPGGRRLAQQVLENGSAETQSFAWQSAIASRRWMRKFPGRVAAPPSTPPPLRILPRNSSLVPRHRIFREGGVRAGARMPAGRGRGKPSTSSNASGVTASAETRSAQMPRCELAGKLPAWALRKGSRLLRALGRGPFRVPCLVVNHRRWCVQAAKTRPQGSACRNRLNARVSCPRSSSRSPPSANHSGEPGADFSSCRKTSLASAS